jgi:hypothetical protein
MVKRLLLSLNVGNYVVTTLHGTENSIVIVHISNIYVLQFLRCCFLVGTVGKPNIKISLQEVGW